jgi:hypothetical protein
LETTERQWTERLLKDRESLEAHHAVVVENVRLQQQRVDQAEVDSWRCRAMEAAQEAAAARPEELGRLVGVLIEQEKKLAHYSDQATGLCVEQLQREVTQLKGQLTVHMLQQQSNSAKGVRGENEVSDAVRRALPQFAVSNTGAETAACDVHARHASGSLLVFESKLKSVVTLGDVTKFVRDVDVLRVKEPQLGGALFVSLASTNIPHKGAFAIDIQHGMPVMYVGFDDAATRGWQLPLCIQLLWALAEHCRRETRADSLTNTLDTLRPWVTRLKKQQGAVEKAKAKFHAYVADTTQFLHVLEGETSELMGVMLALVGDAGDAGGDAVSGAGVSATAVQCDKSKKRGRTRASDKQ